MKASNMLALTVALLLAVGVAGLAKYTGIFNRSAPAAEAAPAPTMILVARQNLFEGITLSGREVRVRPLNPSEQAHYQANRAKYLPPLPEAVQFRILARNVEADQPLLRDDFQDQAIPDALNKRLNPNMRTITLSLPKERVADGLIQVGEHVDVMLTTQIAHAGRWDRGVIKTAAIARDLRVIAKRGSLWTALAPVPQDQPLQYTLEGNAYRTALVLFSQQRGEISLVVTPAAAKRAPAGVRPAATVTIFSDPDSREYRDEDQRVASFLSGESTVGDADLERIFNMKPAPLEPSPVRVEQYVGLTRRGTSTFLPNQEDVENASRPRFAQPDLGYHFRSPSAKPAKTGT